MVARVVEEVADDPVEPSRVRLDDDARRGQRELGRRESSAHDRGDDPPEVDWLEERVLRVRVEARDLHEVVDQRPQAPDVADHQLGRAPRVRREAVDVALDQRRLGDQRGQRRAQLVRDVGDELAVLLLGDLEAAHRRSRASPPCG